MTLTLPTLKTWAAANIQLAGSVMAAQAHAQLTRERVDAYIRPIFESFTFHVAPENAETPGELVKDPKLLFLCEEAGKLADYHARCDAAHREHGFTGPAGHCPALIAENLQAQAEDVLVNSICEVLGLDPELIYLEKREKLVSMALGACVKADQETGRPPELTSQAVLARLGVRPPAATTPAAKPNTIRFAKNGWEMEVTTLPGPVENPDIETHHLLTRTNGKGKYQGKIYRLLRNRLKPNRCFLIAVDNPVESMPALELWVEIQPDDSLKPLT